ncbi:unnamed protein product [Strongylus vulgaris]|uniref:Uncharacterized protein n=1 Tax=Strongylus vulgaris TaxID=40348 RepID=A0A3P7JIW2_STRVU|nr:unnamed protein product [Strongylus vulgaris]
MDDSDLLNPRSSILSDAVRLLEKTIPLIKTGSAPTVAKDFRRLSPFTFSQPDQTRNPLVAPLNTIPATEKRAFLPSRDDPIRPDTPPISPINAAHRELGTFDTHLGRFANGVPNR